MTYKDGRILKIMSERIQDILARQKAAAAEAGSLQAAKGLKDLQKRIARGVARGWFVVDSSSGLATPVAENIAFTRLTFHDYLSEDLKTRGQEITLPEPSQAIVEVHNILAGSGFDVAPVVYVDRKKGEATFGVLETVVRPNYTDGTQMYYSNPDEDPHEDPLAQILERGRTGRQQRIAVPDWVSHVPVKSRFGVSWDEIHNFVAPEVIGILPHLEKQVVESGIVFRVPTKAEFQSAGERYPHLGGANSWEWLYDKAGFDDRLFGGRRGSGGLRAVYVWRSVSHFDNVGFRLQAVSPSRKLPR